MYIIILPCSTDASLQDVILLNKWREEYKVVLLLVEKAEGRQKGREVDDGDDLEKLKRERKKLEVCSFLSSRREGTVYTASACYVTVAPAYRSPCIAEWLAHFICLQKVTGCIHM